MILLLTVGQLMCGLGLVSLFRVKLKRPMLIALWLLCGIAVFSLVPFILQLLYIPLTAVSIWATLITTTLLLNLPYKRNWHILKETIRWPHLRFRLYELPFLLLVIFLVAISVWRCYYFPPTPRDLTSGAEVIAEYAVREKTMINSVFTINLETTNNQFKPPFIIALQIIYKYAGFPFGQLWLSTLFISFLVFLYHALRATLHRALTWVLLLCFIAIPEMYVYTFMALFDYSNALFFFLSIWFLLEYGQTGTRNRLAFAGLLMGFATYIRSETLVLAGILSLVIMLYNSKHKKKWIELPIAGILFLLPALLLYILSISIYVNHYLPATYDVAGLLNKNLLDLRLLWDRFKLMNSQLIFSGQGIVYYSYFFFLFLLVLIVDLVLSRGKQAPAARNWLWATAVIYLGMPLLGYLLPLLDIDNSTKRGLFKIFPLMLLYMASCTALTRLSARLTQWEEATSSHTLENVEAGNP